MSNLSAPPLTPAAEASIRSILEWLALAHDRRGSDDADQLYRQLIRLRDTPLPISHRIKLLDLLHAHGERIVMAELPELQAISLPVSRKTRQRMRILIDLLETLTQEYFNSLAELFDPAGNSALRAPHASLLRALQGIAWQIRINHLLASPTRIGLWQQLHAAYRTARRLGLENFPGPRGGAGVQRAYTDILLAAIAQPASFSASELEFISQFIESSPVQIDLSNTPPADSESTFWIDPDSDLPAHALVRRAPADGCSVLYFSCAAMAAEAQRIHGELLRGSTPETLGLPAFAASRSGRAVLRRLASLWGQPAKRRFTRRRQSYRANLCLGLNNLWHLLKNPEQPPGLSEWMVTNESPDGYALMHVYGSTDDLRIGEVVALQAIRESDGQTGPWHVCIVRWAISENPEHVEIGLQQIAARAFAAEVAQPFELSGRHMNAVVLPQTPPLRPVESLLVPTGKLEDKPEPLVLLIESDNLLVREVRTEKLDEQTSSIDLFSLTPVDSA